MRAPLCARPYGVEMSPPLVATSQRPPHRTIDSTRPTPGTVSPRPTRQTPFGPSTTAKPLVTSRKRQSRARVWLRSSGRRGRPWLRLDRLRRRHLTDDLLLLHGLLLPRRLLLLR